MRLSLIKNILRSFLIAAGGLLLTCLVALVVLEQAVSMMEHPEIVRIGQLVILLVGAGCFLGGIVCMVIAANQAQHILERLKQATQKLANVVLDDDEVHDPAHHTDDLEREIQSMMRKIKASQQLCLDASPLTRLPGNIAIEQVLKEKMDRGEHFALCYIDLDDFKAYNDKYGYAKGSELIKMTGDLIYKAKDSHASQQDFVGHIGGDDFVLITSPETAENVCQVIVSTFDESIPAYYDERDRERGFIEGVDRYGTQRRFPLMTISIAVVSDLRRKFNSPIEIAQVATEIKDYVKSMPGSNYLIDRRTSTRWGV